jgi:hypothetical protein
MYTRKLENRAFKEIALGNGDVGYVTILSENETLKVGLTLFN